MLEIILLILKILLYVILGLLGFILLVLLLVIFVPIRYRIKGSMHDEQPDGFAEVSWLLHLIQARLLIREKKPALDLRILGIRLGGNKKEDEGESSEEEPGTEETAETGPAEEDTAGSIEEHPPDGEDAEVTENPEESEDAGTEEAEEAGETAEEAPRGLKGKIGALYRKLRQTAEEKIEQVKALLKDLEDKKEFLTRAKVKAAIRHVLRMVMKMLKHILPHKARGNVRFGLDSPADTGTVTAILSATMPVHKNKVRMTPDFDRKVLEGDLNVKGRIIIAVLIALAVRIILNRNVLYFLKNFKKHFSKKAKEEQ